MVAPSLPPAALLRALRADALSYPVEPAAQQGLFADRSGFAQEDQKGGLKDVFAILVVLQKAHTPSTIGPCRCTSAEKAA
jgi:hypothetical protein